MIDSYVSELASRYKTGNATEHTYRGDLQQLLQDLVPEIRATNEPKRIECGAPDYVITRKSIPVGYIEAKDIGVDLNGKNLKEQFDRYREALDNLVFTDYLDFHFYVNGEPTAKIKIGEVHNGKVVARPENYEQFTNLIKEFCSRTPVTIKSSKRLAEMMADKAKILAFIIKSALEEDFAAGTETDLTNQFQAFKDILIHDIDAKAFADIYAQTIAYGMFAARLHDKDLETFSRQEAAAKIPKTNPFLRKLFQFIAAFDLDTRIDWIVDALADLFRATDIGAILKNFGRSTQTHDPIMHFYETFLAEYDPKLRKARGVFYTPEPVVDFIVRAVDDILKSEFNLPNGLADTRKTKITVKSTVKDERTKSGYREDEKEVHKVQILDPATGTGTFLASVIKQIYKQFEGQQGIWSDYVDNHLVQRLNGFEVLMASYAMAHLKLDLLLGDTGYASSKDNRFHVYLTNSLEEYHPDTGTLFAGWLSSEANEANHIKRDTPVMAVIGNPPYSGESANKGEWIMSLMEDYKKEPGGIAKLKERNPKWINDDYVKFLRYGQHFIEKYGEGVLAFINPHGYLDNPTFRGMRWNLLKTYDKLFIIDLHGNSKKKELSPDGSKDENVFDIQQGVLINVFLKTGRKKKEDLAEIFHFDLFGTRERKYKFLLENSLKTVPFVPVQSVAPNYYLLPKDFNLQAEYEKGVSITEMFPTSTVGVVTANDSILVSHNESTLLENVGEHYGVKPEADLVRSYAYRLFDNRYIYYSADLIERSREKTMRHMSVGKNLGIVTCRQTAVNDWCHISVTDRIMDDCLLSNRTKERGYLFPLYLYPDATLSPDNSSPDPLLNLNRQIVSAFAEKLGLEFVEDDASEEYDEPPRLLTPTDIVDYVYAILHSRQYRDKYLEFLKIDFPRVPYPRDAKTFWELVALGAELRGLHLLESSKVGRFITKFPANGDHVVTKHEFKEGNVYLNASEYFEGVPEVAWNIFIGGYQPAQKWLKDRKGRALSFEDIQHYQKIIVALTETDRLMKEIDKIDFLS